MLPGDEIAILGDRDFAALASGSKYVRANPTASAFSCGGSWNSQGRISFRRGKRPVLPIRRWSQQIPAETVVRADISRSAGDSETGATAEPCLLDHWMLIGDDLHFIFLQPRNHSPCLVTFCSSRLRVYSCFPPPLRQRTAPREELFLSRKNMQPVSTASPRMTHERFSVRWWKGRCPDAGPVRRAT